MTDAERGANGGARVHPTAVVEPGAMLGDGVEIGPFCVVGKEAVIGDRTKIMAGAQVLGRTVMGADNRIFPYAVIGGMPQDKKFRGEHTRLEIGDRNDFREHCTIHIGTAEEHGGEGVTRIGNDNLFMACSHVAHDCVVEDGVVLSNNVLLAGHVHVESGAIVSGNTAIHQFVTIGTLAYIGGVARVTMDAPPYLILEGRPGKIRGINKVGLLRHGFPDASVQALREAYWTLFHAASTLEEGLAELEGRTDLLPEVRRLVDFLRRSERSVKGRYLESLRRERAAAPAEGSGRGEG